MTMMMLMMVLVLVVATNMMVGRMSLAVAVISIINSINK